MYDLPCLVAVGAFGFGYGYRFLVDCKLMAAASSFVRLVVLIY